ncbi:unnamed protein product [Peronospora belbahrii]|uniref:Uncharacterized protein n=1 Tax=Peronospora belbahrii TaxID=622444 RepID=A0ABN8CZG7_9STRA|nr:unnamed protein product [Peronospora belbahrii]
MIADDAGNGPGGLPVLHIMYQLKPYEITITDRAAFAQLARYFSAVPANAAKKRLITRLHRCADCSLRQNSSSATAVHATCIVRSFLTFGEKCGRPFLVICNESQRLQLLPGGCPSFHSIENWLAMTIAGRRRGVFQFRTFIAACSISECTRSFHTRTGDKQGFFPVRVFLSFNKLKILKATERMILDAAENSLTIQADRSRFCIAPKIMPAAGLDDSAIDARTIYIDSFGATDDHDSLRQVFAQFGKSFPINRLLTLLSTTSDANLKGIRVMRKTRWLEMKEQLKRQLYHNDAAAVGSSKNVITQDDGI